MGKKISVVGAGNVGSSLAQRLAEKGYDDVVLLDIIDGLPQGKALDILQSLPITGCDAGITGTNDYKDTAGSDVVVITSGTTRKPGMTRDELLKTNTGIITEVTQNIVRYSPGCTIVIVTNPVDAMTYLALKVSGFSPSRVVGLSGALDSARLSSFIAAELKVSVSEVSSLVMGEHGQNMVVIPRLATVKGTPITELLPRETIERLVERTVNGGAEIVGLLKTGSAFYAPAAAAACMVEA
ncbi:MAG: malate dehydrogenase, partial [Dehalococcoidales bacterium]|nr:malate dehydrogenase [Dehalococcoidales bacterium]